MLESVKQLPKEDNLIPEILSKRCFEWCAFETIVVVVMPEVAQVGKLVMCEC